MRMSSQMEDLACQIGFDNLKKYMKWEVRAKWQFSPLK
jgi:hypothetical protein